MLRHALTHLIDRQVDLISYFQASIQSSYVKHVASSDLHVLHCEFCFLYKEGNAPSERGERPRGDRESSQSSELQLERSQLRARLVCATGESRVSPGTAHRAAKQRKKLGHSYGPQRS